MSQIVQVQANAEDDDSCDDNDDAKVPSTLRPLRLKTAQPGTMVIN